MNWNHDSYEVEEDGDQNDVEHDGSGHNHRQNDDNEKLVDRESSGRKFAASSGRRVAARDSRAGEEDWTKRKKQNKTSKAEEAEEHKSKRRAKARRVEAGLRRK